MGLSDQMQRYKETFKNQAALLLGLAALCWGLEALDALLGVVGLSRFSPDALGIRPRQLTGLPGIFCGPFLHGSWGHLTENTIPFLILGWLVLVSGRSTFSIVSIGAACISGLGVWLFGEKDTLHLGASGLVFGYLGFLLARGWIERNLFSAIVAIVVGAVYLGTLLSLFVVQATVSWSGHFFGFVGGITMATLLCRRPER